MKTFQNIDEKTQKENRKIVDVLNFLSLRATL